MQNWIKVGTESQFTDGLHPIKLGPRSNVVIARLKGKLFAFDALCPHAQGPMDRSEIEGAIVSCPLHAWRFDLENDGKELHGYRSLTVHSLKVADGEVYISLAA
jgi:nitrite reductase/ring-hydroxylating ferredoxin subunit